MSLTLEQSLQRLEEAGLIRLALAYPNLEYLFRHALLQETTYQTILRADRKLLHQMVGEVLERADGERRAVLAPLLAHPFDHAGDEIRATAYYLLAGDQAARIYANAESVAIKVARTIADLAGSPRIQTAHMAEAIQYRQRKA